MQDPNTRGKATSATDPTLTERARAVLADNTKPAPNFRRVCNEWSRTYTGGGVYHWMWRKSACNSKSYVPGSDGRWPRARLLAEGGAS